MAPNTITRRCLSWFALMLVFGAAVIPFPVSASPVHESPAFRDLASFVASVMDGNPQNLRGVYAPGILALAVVQQPNAAFVSAQPDTATQFRMAAAQQGVIGLLAHNFLGGRDFSRLALGQPIVLVYGDGKMQAYTVTTVYRYQATKPESVYSSFVDLQTNAVLDTATLFKKVFTGGQHVTFQTCIAGDGNPSWGRLFVIAEPATDLHPALTPRASGALP